MSVHTATVRPGTLLERDAELAVARAALTRAAGGTGGALLVQGVPGVGKSQLLARVRSHARELGMRVLEARGAVIEREFAFGVVRQLFEPIVVALDEPERAQLFSGAATLAGTLLGQPVASSPERGDAEFGALHGLYWLTVNLADTSPLLLSVDDAQWSDSASLRFLSYLTRRLDGLSVLVAATGRSSDPEGDELWPALTEEPAVELIHPRALSEVAVAHVVRSNLGEHSADAFCHACHRATSGNPLFLVELVGALANAGVEPTAAAAEAVTDVGPPAVGRFVLHRLERLGEPAIALARAVAVLGGPIDPMLAARAAGLDVAEARRVADLLVRADVFAPDQLLRFVHPIVQAAVYEDLLPGDRAARHLAAVRLFEEVGAAPERLAAHLLKAGPTGDARSVEVLRAAAAKAGDRGDPAGAAAYLRRALDEPPPADRTPEVLCDLGRLEVATRSYEAAQEHLLAALALPARPQLRTHAAVWLARAGITWGNAQAAAGAFEAILGELGSADREAALELEAEALNLVRLELSLRELVPEWLERFTRHAAGSPRFEPVARIHNASEQLVRGEPAAAAAEAIEDVLASVPPSDPFAFGVGLEGLILTERYASASRWLELALEAGRAIGFATRIANLHTQRAVLALAQGAVGDAQLDAQTALELAGTDHFYAPRVIAIAIAAAIERGELEAAQELAEDRDARLGRERLFVDEFLTSRGNLRIAQGRVQEGLADLLRCGELHARYGTQRPGDWLTPAVAALIALGERDQARRLAGEALPAAERFGTAKALTQALRASGMAAGGERGLAHLERAVMVAKASPARLELARAYADLGSELVRQRRRREGREVLRLGLEKSISCGATALAERIRADMSAGGGRPPRVVLQGLDALTPAERRICDLVADNLTNREAAQKLFVTEKTIELHLTNAYRKLGIRSRFQLASVMSPTPAPGPSGG